MSKPIRAWQAGRTGIGSLEMGVLLTTSYGDLIASDVVRVPEHVLNFLVSSIALFANLALLSRGQFHGNS